MKKSLIVLLAVAALALWGGAAQAAVTGTSHGISGAQGGFCGACHIPHASGGSRLWVENPVSGTVTIYVGEVAPLCGYCHYSNMGGAQLAAISNSYVYGVNSHGRWMNASIMPEGQVASGLPYMTDATDGAIECTSCHNVHDDTARPFLRAGINEICSMCHGYRRQSLGGGWLGGPTAGSTAVAAWGSTWTGDGNVGSHPIGTDITGDVYNGDSPIVIPNVMAVGVTDAPDRWTLGGHLTSGQTGGVICVTCHAVHGIHYDSNGPGQGITTTDNRSPFVNFLAVEQNSAALAGERSIANGNAMYNALCEACHQGSESSTYGATNTTYPNPGGTSFGHPVDDMAVQGGASWVTGFPTNWPAGLGWSASDGDPNPICESCHVPHAYADSTRSDDSLNTFGASDYILRDSRPLVCGDCHTTTGGQRHHPVAITFQQPVTGAANYLENVAPGVNTLECATCHTDGGAHNWDARSAVGLDASWLPVDNARTATYSTGMGKTCMDCHNNLTGVFRWSPTKNNGVSTSSVYSPGTEGYDLHGNSSHYIGELDPRGFYSATGAAYWTSLTGGLGAWLNPQTTAWSTGFGGVGGYSRFGGTSTAPVLVCESCHELEADKTSATHLLLATYTEQTLGAAFTRTADFLCNGCHLPRGTHQMTNDLVSTNRQAGATALNTDTAVAWLSTPSSGPTMGNGDQFTCDSCHQPHDAPTPGRTYILDVAASVLSNAGQGLIAGTTADYGTAYATSIDSETTQVNYQRFCDKCHPYN